MVAHTVMKEHQHYPHTDENFDHPHGLAIWEVLFFPRRGLDGAQQGIQNMLGNGGREFS